jgi:hypothetical protein
MVSSKLLNILSANIILCGRKREAAAKTLW